MQDAPEQQPFTVYVDDNAHHMDDDYHWTAGVYETYGAALARCRAMAEGAEVYTAARCSSRSMWM